MTDFDAKNLPVEATTELTERKVSAAQFARDWLASF